MSAVLASERKRATYAHTVALAVSLHGPFSPVVLTQRSM
jgi:hypothetical protein